MRIAFIPGTLALVPAYQSILDPVPDLRAACQQAAAWVAAGTDLVTVVGDPARAADVARGATQSTADVVAEALLPAGVGIGASDERYLVVLNGSYARTEKAPGHLDERAFSFDEALEAALESGDPAGLGKLDPDLAAELGAFGVAAAAATLPAGSWNATIDWSGDPFGVQYWVVRWNSES